MSPIISLQNAIITRLANDAALLALIPINLTALKTKDMRLYQYIPSDAISPYINIVSPTISQVYVAPEQVVDVRVSLHIWHNQKETRQYGNEIIAQCLEAVKRALRFRLSPTGFNVLQVTINEERIFDDVNPDVKHAVFTLTYKLEKNVGGTDNGKNFINSSS